MQIPMIVPDSVLEEIVLENLKEAYFTAKEISDDPKWAKALRKVFRYYSDPTQWEEFKREAR